MNKALAMNLVQGLRHLAEQATKLVSTQGALFEDASQAWAFNEIKDNGRKPRIIVSATQGDNVGVLSELLGGAGLQSKALA